MFESISGRLVNKFWLDPALVDPVTSKVGTPPVACMELVITATSPVNKKPVRIKWTK
jgi:hypothetical protein